MRATGRPAGWALEVMVEHKPKVILPRASQPSCDTRRPYYETTGALEHGGAPRKRLTRYARHSIGAPLDRRACQSIRSALTG